MIKNLLKRVCPLILAVVLLLSVIVVNVSAIAGSTSISLSKQNPKVGDTLTVTVRYTLNNVAQGAQGSLNFDSQALKFISASGGTANCVGSSVNFVAVGNDSSYYFRVDFQVIAEGTSALSVTNALCSDDEEYELPGSSVRVTTKNASSNNSSQDTNTNTSAALKSITVAAGTLNPAFSPNVTKYTVVVPYTQTDGILSCQSLDPNASISVEGDRQLKVGNNTRVIVVVASNGDTRRYTVVFNRLDENGNDTTSSENTGISVTVDSKEYYISQQDATLTPPAGFALSTIMYGESEVAAYKSSSGKITLLYLVSAETGEGDFFLYENAKCSALTYISCGESTYIIKDITDAAPEGLYKDTYDLNGKTVSCYKYTDTDYADFIVFSAVSNDGNSGYYRYDQNEKTMQRVIKFAAANADAPKDIEVGETTRTVVLALIALFAVILIVLIIVLVLKASNRKGKNIKNIFDTEEEYDMESSSDEP